MSAAVQQNISTTSEESNSILERRPDGRANNGRSPNSMANLRPWKPGSTGRVNVPASPLKQVQQYARDKSMSAVQALSAMVEDPEEDSRVVIIAAQTILTWAFGKPPDYDPNSEKPSVLVDFSRLDTAQLQLLKTLLDSGAIRPTDAAPAPSESEAALASEVDDGEQVTIEGSATSA